MPSWQEYYKNDVVSFFKVSYLEAHIIYLLISPLVMLILLTCQCVVLFLHYRVIHFPLDTFNNFWGDTLRPCKHSALYRTHLLPAGIPIHMIEANDDFTTIALSPRLSVVILL